MHLDLFRGENAERPGALAPGAPAPRGLLHCGVKYTPTLRGFLAAPVGDAAGVCAVRGSVGARSAVVCGRALQPLCSACAAHAACRPERAPSQRTGAFRSAALPAPHMLPPILSA